jgi:RNA polymerase sigma factor (sigma-70 family)
LICPAKSAQELLAEFRATGQQQPFEEIVRRYAAMVFHVCFQVLKNRHDAEDATQAVFLTLAVQGKTDKEIRNIGPWLQQVAKRLSLDLRKARKRRAAREHRHGLSNSSCGNPLALGSGLDGQELRHILSEELNHLAPKYRLPLILHYFGGLSREQMSAELGCKETTLGVRLHRGREMLAARLCQRGVTLTAAGLGLLLSYMVREAVTENLIWSTSHVASQMAAGHPVGAGMVSARVMALARGAGNTLAIAKVKAIVASVLIAATAVAAGEVISQVRPMDLRLQRPAGDRLYDLLRPKLPQLRSDVTPPQPAVPPETTVATTSQNPPAVESTNLVRTYSAGPFMPAAGAEWGGSILSAQWIGSATCSHIPGLMWSSAPPPPASGFSYTGRSYAVGPLAAPLAREANQQPPIPFMARPTVGPVNNAAPYANVPPKSTKRAEPDQSAPQQFRIQMQLAPAGEVPPIDPVASAPKLFLDPSPIDLRSHPVMPPPPAPPPTSAPPPVVVASTGGQVWSAGTDFNIHPQTNSVEEVALSDHWTSDSFTRGDSVTGILDFSNSPQNRINVPVIVLGQQSHPLQPQWHNIDSDLTPQIVTGPSAQSVATIKIAAGSMKGYGIAPGASELNQNGQVIADGFGQARTLDLSSVGPIKNSIDNAPTGHNGWFAQNKGKLVLPAVAIKNGEATWAEDPADPQLDLINSVRLHIDPALVGSIKLALLSTDRSDYPALPGSLKPIGLWHIESMDLLLAGIDITARYDIDLANDLQVSGDLNLWGYDGEWKLADASSIDLDNRLINGHFGSIDYFAVAGSSSVQSTPHINSTPEPAAMLSIACAGLILSRRRRKHS